MDGPRFVREPMKTTFGSLLAAVLLLAIVGAGRVLYRACTTRAPQGCVNQLHLIYMSKEQWLSEGHPTSKEAPNWDDLRPYLGRGTEMGLPRCPAGGVYTIGRLGEPPSCSLGGPDHTLPPLKGWTSDDDRQLQALTNGLSNVVEGLKRRNP